MNGSRKLFTRRNVCHPSFQHFLVRKRYLYQPECFRGQYRRRLCRRSFCSVVQYFVELGFRIRTDRTWNHSTSLWNIH